MALFTGLSAFPFTPLDAEMTLNEAVFAQDLERCVAAGVASVAVMGSTGLFAYLPAPTRIRIMECAAEVLGDRVPWMAGVGALSTQDCLTLAEAAGRAGAHAIFASPVSYTPLTQPEAADHYTALTNVGLPVCVYNNPSTTHFTFSRDLIVHLAKTPGIASIKMPLPADGAFAAEIEALRAQVPPDFAIGYSADWGMVAALQAGADVFYSAVGGSFPAATQALARAAQAGDAETVAAGAAAFARLFDLFQHHGSLRILAAAKSQEHPWIALPRPLRLPQRDDATLDAKVRDAVADVRAWSPALA